VDQIGQTLRQRKVTIYQHKKCMNQVLTSDEGMPITPTRNTIYCPSCRHDVESWDLHIMTFSNPVQNVIPNRTPDVLQLVPAYMLNNIRR
jgi:hypothetical protein